MHDLEEDIRADEEKVKQKVQEEVAPEDEEMEGVEEGPAVFVEPMPMDSSMTGAMLAQQHIQGTIPYPMAGGYPSSTAYLPSIDEQTAAMQYAAAAAAAAAVGAGPQVYYSGAYPNTDLQYAATSGAYPNTDLQYAATSGAYPNTDLQYAAAAGAYPNTDLQYAAYAAYPNTDAQYQVTTSSTSGLTTGTAAPKPDVAMVKYGTKALSDQEQRDRGIATVFRRDDAALARRKVTDKRELDPSFVSDVYSECYPGYCFTSFPFLLFIYF